MSYAEKRFVYEITCASDGSVYVGSTWDSPKRWREHLWAAQQSLRPLYRSMRRWGIGAFRLTVVASFTDHYEALEFERHRKQELSSQGVALLSADKHLKSPRPGISWLDKKIILARHALAMSALEAAR